MNKPSEAEHVVADVLARGLAGTLRIGLADASRIAMAARTVKPERVAPLALRCWIVTDPTAPAVLRDALRLV